MKATDDVSTSGPLTVGTQPITLHLPHGTAIFALRGQAWVTQEGSHDDVIVDRGQRFTAHGHGSVVVSATRDKAELLIVRPALARAHPATDVYGFARSYALQLRREALARAGAAAATAFRSLVARARGALATRPRMPA